MNFDLKLLQKMALVIVIVLFVFTAGSYMFIETKSSNVFSNDLIQQFDSNKTDIAVVFGGGVSDSYPLPLLKDRLDKAKEILDDGIVNKLILSGDNRSLEYNEPTVMYQYLVDSGVSSEHLQADFAGRSTYETCERANKIFGLDKAYLISESTHLPRAIFLCEHFGIESIGVTSDGKTSSGLQLGQRWREILARNKAIINAYIIGEETVLGEPIEID